MKLKYLFLLSILFLIFIAPSFSQTCHTYDCNCRTETKTYFSPWTEWIQTNIIVSRTPIYETTCGYSSECVEKNVYYTTQEEDRWIRVFGWTYHYKVNVRIRHEVCYKTKSVRKCVRKFKGYKYNYLKIPKPHLFKTESKWVCDRCRRCEDDPPSPPPTPPVDDGDDDRDNGSNKTEFGSSNIKDLEIYDTSLGEERRFGKELSVSFSLRNCYGNVEYTVEGCGDKKSGTAVCGSNNIKIKLKKEGSCSIRLNVEDNNGAKSKNLGSITVKKSRNPPGGGSNNQCKKITVENVNVEFNSGGWLEFWRGKKSTISFNLNCDGTAQYKIDLCGDVKSGTTKCGSQKFDFNTKGGCIVHLWSKNGCSEIDKDIAYISKDYEYMIRNETEFEGTTVFVNNSITYLYPSEGEVFIENLEDGVYDNEINKLYSKGLSDKAMYLFLTTSVFGSAALLSNKNRERVIEILNSKIGMFNERKKIYKDKESHYNFEKNKYRFTKSFASIFPMFSVAVDIYNIKNNPVGFILSMIDTMSNSFFNTFKRNNIIKKYDLPDPRLQTTEEIKNYLKKLSGDYYRNFFMTKDKKFAQERYYSYLDLINHDLVFVGDSLTRYMTFEDIKKFFIGLGKEIASLKTLIIAIVSAFVGFVAGKIVEMLLTLLLAATSGTAAMITLSIIAILLLIVGAVELHKKFSKIINNIKNLSIIAALIGKDNEPYEIEFNKLTSNSYEFLIDYIDYALNAVPTLDRVGTYYNDITLYGNAGKTYEAFNRYNNLYTDKELNMDVLPELEYDGHFHFEGDEDGIIVRKMRDIYENYGIKGMDTYVYESYSFDFNAAYEYNIDEDKINFYFKPRNPKIDETATDHEAFHMLTDEDLVNRANLITKEWINGETYKLMKQMKSEKLDFYVEYIDEIFQKAVNNKYNNMDKYIDYLARKRFGENVESLFDDVEDSKRYEIIWYVGEFEEYGDYQEDLFKMVDNRIKELLDKGDDEVVKRFGENAKEMFEKIKEDVANEIKGEDYLDYAKDKIKQDMDDLDVYLINECVYNGYKRKLNLKTYINDMTIEIYNTLSNLRKEMKYTNVVYAVENLLTEHPELPIDLGYMKFMCELYGNKPALDNIQKIYEIFDSAVKKNPDAFTVKGKTITEVMDEMYSFSKEYFEKNKFDIDQLYNNIKNKIITSSGAIATHSVAGMGAFMIQGTSIEIPSNPALNEMVYQNQKMIENESKGPIPISYFRKYN